MKIAKQEALDPRIPILSRCTPSTGGLRIAVAHRRNHTRASLITVLGFVMDGR